jgi:tyrosinase
LAQPANAARDPLFFLLHANTDRLWAKWQRLKGRFDPSIADSYGPSTCVAAGQCLTDTMWPWNTPSSPGGNFAEGLGRWLLPPSSPMPGNVLSIDRSYIWFAGSGQWQQASAGLGYSYDDTPSTP